MEPRLRTPQEERELDATLERIAQQHLRVTTLESRQSDAMDFYDLAVWNLKAALEAAFEAGRREQSL
jgi:hypothetical protein